jgi:hypothetical protein
MNGRPGEGPGHDPAGRAIGPTGTPPTWQAGGCAPSFSTRRLTCYGDGGRPLSAREKAGESCLAAFQGLEDISQIWSVCLTSGLFVPPAFVAAPISTASSSADAKAERERSEREVRGGGWERRESGWMATAVAGPATGKREGGAEAVPSAGWREVAAALDADGGASHR